MATKAAILNSPADMLDYDAELIRTGQCLPIGRMSRVAIGPSADYTPPPNDPIIAKYGRMIDLRNTFLPIAQSLDRTIVLVTSPLLDRDGRVTLPSLPDPTWEPEKWTEDEVKDAVLRDPVKDMPHMVEQRLEDRTNQRLKGTGYMIFQPVLRITYQVELDKKFQPLEWRISFRPDSSGRHCAFLVHEHTGECHFVFGVPSYDGDARG